MLDNITRAPVLFVEPGHIFFHNLTASAVWYEVLRGHPVIGCTDKLHPIGNWTHPRTLDKLYSSHKDPSKEAPQGS